MEECPNCSAPVDLLQYYCAECQDELDQARPCTICGEPGAADDGLCDDCAAESEPWTCLDCGKPSEEGEDLCEACGSKLICFFCQLEQCVCEPVYEDEP